MLINSSRCSLIGTGLSRLCILPSHHCCGSAVQGACGAHPDLTTGVIQGHPDLTTGVVQGHPDLTTGAV